MNKKAKEVIIKFEQLKIGYDKNNELIIILDSKTPITFSSLDLLRYLTFLYHEKAYWEDYFLLMQKKLPKDKFEEVAKKTQFILLGFVKANAIETILFTSTKAILNLKEEGYSLKDIEILLEIQKKKGRIKLSECVNGKDKLKSLTENRTRAYKKLNGFIKKSLLKVESKKSDGVGTPPRIIGIDVKEIEKLLGTSLENFNIYFKQIKKQKDTRNLSIELPPKFIIKPKVFIRENSWLQFKSS